MSSLAFVTHPSVRIKGTENSYTPTQCLDELCPVKAPHLHCPFCVKSDAYQDPVILKAHYRVKHVDKGIDFAGLKILRCCDQCDIIGIIKGEKRFKGAHWHCYRCRNGFNRRDEAIKHYKTHFRNPQTTFQIQITQDLNSPPIIRTPSEDRTGTTQDSFASIENPVQEIIHPALTETLSLSETNVMTTDTGTNGKLQKVKVKHEPLDKDLSSGDHEDQQTIMIIQGDQLESALASHIINSGELSVLNKANLDPSISWEIRFRMEEEEKNMYKAKAQEYKVQVELLQQQVSELQSQVAQQSELKLQDFIDSLSAGDIHKQALGVQLAKFMEQMQSSQNSENSSESLPAAEHLHSNTSLVELTNSAASLQHLESNATMTQLSGIPEGYQVITTTPEGHVIVGKAPSPSLTPEDSISVIADDSNIGDNSISNITPSSVPETPSVVNPQKQPEQEVLIEGDVLSESMNAPPSQPLMGEGEVHSTDLTVLSEIATSEDSLLHAVASDEERVSLNTNVTVVAPVDSGQSGQEAYMMDIVDGNRILIKGTVDGEPVQTVMGHEVTQVTSNQKAVSEETAEPEAKRIRVAL
ncbi:uncharacterized protein LOC101858864 [Aplysia californica]|uniref:Uncharacterized protein LOC101858864 n=1 Tax=Aplysia californica TaxID=6500 RepID=A0ABM0JSF0_APLCA|nr:uncharacterized protein LOC101858864 [Aplysia californica]